MSWQEVAFDGFISNVAGGAIGGVVAHATVRWTLRGDRDAAVSAERQRAAESMVRATLAMAGPVADHMGRRGSANAGGEALKAWIAESEVQSPVLEGVPDPVPHIAAFRQCVSEAFKAEQQAREVEDRPFTVIPGQPGQPNRPTYVEWRRATSGVVEMLVELLIVQLQASRRGEPTQGLPAPFRPPVLEADGPAARARAGMSRAARREPQP